MTTPPDRLRFEYTRTTGPGYMDQTLDILNTGLSAVVPTLEFTAVDRLGAPLPDVTVTTVFGSHRGDMVVPAEGWSFGPLFRTICA